MRAHPIVSCAAVSVLLALGMPPTTAFAALGFGSSALLDSADTGNHDQNPSVAHDGSGNWVAVWTSGGMAGADYDIRISRSSDNGVSWTPSVTLNSNAATDSGNDLAPVVATDGSGHWVCVWTSDDTLGNTVGSDLDIFVARSSDNGMTWTAVAALNTNAATDSGDDTNPSLCTDGLGNWIAAWHSDDTLGDTIGSDYDILVSRSMDNGANWTAPAKLNKNAATDTGDDRFVDVATDGAGNWLATWTSDEDLEGMTGTEGDIFASRSTNNGTTWTAVTALNSNATTDSGADIGSKVATDGAGTWVVVWSSKDDLGDTIGTDDDILFARSTDDGDSWSVPAALNTNAASDSGNDVSPWIASEGSGKWVAVWTSNDSLGGAVGSDNDIFVSRSSNNGATWIAPSVVNVYADVDYGADWNPVAAYGGDGSWIVVWYGGNQPDGSPSFDNEILFASSNSVFVDSLRIVSPNGGESWRIGKKAKIEWISSGVPGSRVTLDLLRNGNTVRTIKDSTRNDGKQRWKVPASVSAGNGYKVRITSTTNDDITDSSDAKFRIKSEE